MAITALPTAPQRTDSPDVFATRADTWVAALSTWTTEANALQVDVNNKQVLASANQAAAELAETNAETAQAASEAARDLADNWATKTDGAVSGGEFSAKEYALGTNVAAGSAKDWANQTGSTVNGSEYSAKEYASGSFVPSGSAKEWATTAEDTLVDGSEYSAKHYAAKAAASVAVIPAGTINDSLIAADKTWSSTKINDELSLVTPIETIQTFTSNGTFTVPSGVTRIKVRLWGGGGSGGKRGLGTSVSGGGGGGGYSEKIIITTPGSIFSVTIGIGGPSRSDVGGIGYNGGTTSFGSEFSATGGAGGSLYYITRTTGGTGVSGDLNIQGGDGYYTSDESDSALDCTIGGASPQGGCSVARTNIGVNNGYSGLFPGGGGTGSSTGTSGAGANGLCIVEW